MHWLLAYLGLQVLGTVAGDFVEFPNPQKDFMLCGRRNASFICDPDFLLDVGDVDRLDYLAHELQASTTCLCSTCETGISVGVFIRRNLTKQTIQMYQRGKGIAEMLRKKWHLGQCEDDIVIVIIGELNITDYSMGVALQEIFPQDTAQLIMKDCSVHFQSGWYYQGLESVLRSFNDELVRLQRKTTGSQLDMSLITGLSLGIGVLLILLIISILLLRRQNKRRKRGCSDIYDSVPAKNKYLCEKIGEYQVDKMQKQFSIDEEENDDDDDDLTSDDENIVPSQRLIQLKRQLSAVEEESYEEDVLKKDFEVVPLNGTSRSQQEHLRQITEL